MAYPPRRLTWSFPGSSPCNRYEISRMTGQDCGMPAFMEDALALTLPAIDCSLIKASCSQFVPPEELRSGPLRRDGP